VANDLFYELLPEKNEAKSESESEAATLRPPQYYEAKYEPTLRSLIRQLKAYVTREVEAAEKKEGDDPLASLLNQNTHSRRYAPAPPPCSSFWHWLGIAHSSLLFCRGKQKGKGQRKEG
jgi:hypothetical protein